MHEEVGWLVVTDGGYGPRGALVPRGLCVLARIALASDREKKGGDPTER